MLQKKVGFPAVSEVVLCTVKKILYNSVFVTLDEYNDREGIIHISEIAPGRIRTIREYVKEGKKIVCLILRVYPERNHIELSLRRVTTSIRIKKNEDLKLEQKSEKILEIVANAAKIPFQTLYKDVGLKIINEYGSLHACFQQLPKENTLLSKLPIEKKIAKQITELAVARFRPPEVKVTKNLKVKCMQANGIKIIKDALLKAIKVAESKKYNLKVLYVGAPNYRLTVTADDYRSAESTVNEIALTIINDIKAHNGEAELAK